LSPSPLFIMLANIAIGSALVSGSFAALLPASPVDSSPEALVTPGPSHHELFGRQNNIRDVGWKFDPSWVMESCNPSMSAVRACIKDILTLSRQHVLRDYRNIQLLFTRNQLSEHARRVLWHRASVPCRCFGVGHY
jgi:hypothetical protein